MIKTKNDYNDYIKQDALSMGIKINSVKNRLVAKLSNPRWKFIVTLRKCEYHKNNKNKPLSKILYGYYFYKYKTLGVKLGFTIPANVCSKGLSLPHYGTIIISKNATIGENCRIHACVNIGASAGSPEAPKIGKNVYIGPGAKLFGDIQIGDSCTIGANAVVNKSFTDQNCVIGGIPAKILKENKSDWLADNNLA
ncbi:serine acetyltransferase [Echinicola soli]|uniref:Serine acetyltransferase n=1 Tax=Echinicola soli TaxID=2591634 RepID=A0A514CHI7_9BACT|nr:serine acetyltransferase [Echinicola soli]QDH79297.1 serine acetyltransferase [Echinicola soli]